MSLAPGTRLGRYEIRGILGTGGMAEVYLAEDTALGRRVALKLLPPDTRGDPHAHQRLLREARAAATLDHPHICAVYDVGASDGHEFIAMQLVEGRTLDIELGHGPLGLEKTLQIACDVADALAEAHAHGVIHRDIKPSNVMITPRGGAVVLDFGLAKLVRDDERAAAAATASLLTAPGVMLGTVPYMSPEQVRGESIDERSDLFSFGAMLYEMLSGRRAFAEPSSAAIASAILTREPPPLSSLDPSLPSELGRIVAKALRKNANDRYQTARDLLVDLRTLREEQDFQRRLERSGPGSGAAPAMTAAARRTWRRRAIAAAALLIVAAGGWYAWRAARTRAALAMLPRIEALAAEMKYAEAYDLALDVERVIPTDPALARLMPEISMTFSAKTDPAGASVYLTPFVPDAASPAERRLAGMTPLDNVRVARGEYVLAIEKDGYAPIERTVSGRIIRFGGFSMPPPTAAIDQTLVPVDRMPARMVAVPGGPYRLVAWSRPTDRRVALADFFIDKFEVTNADYQEFITAGGYLKRDLWQHPFVKDGRTLSWEDAMKLLVDRTGLPGPRGWSSQTFPEGQADRPATDISWYEAAAYAAFRGKRLPTVFEWEKAARNGAGGSATFMPWGVFNPGNTLAGHANFDNNGTVPADSLPFGMSPFGAYNMAGNVAEWTFNDTSEGRIATGGAWGNPSYTFAQYSLLPGFYSSNKIGFRCAQLAPGATGSQGAERIEIAQEIPVFAPSSDADFAKWTVPYRYAATPLDARVEDVTETPQWRRERISFAGADGQRAYAYLYLPHHFPRPLQVVHFVPGGDVHNGYRSLPDSIEDRVAPFIQTGRAAFGVVLQGYVERLRPPGFVRPDLTTTEYLDAAVSQMTDLRRGLDYLGTRPEIDTSRIAFFGPSAGAQIGLVLAAVETRYRGVVLVGAGLSTALRDVYPAANTINFASHIRGPVLMLHGKYDEDTPLKTRAEPLYALLRCNKKLVVYEGSHVPPTELAFSVVSAWLDETMGTVKR